MHLARIHFNVTDKSFLCFILCLWWIRRRKKNLFFSFKGASRMWSSHTTNERRRRRQSESVKCIFESLFYGLAFRELWKDVLGKKRATRVETRSAKRNLRRIISSWWILITFRQEEEEKKVNRFHFSGLIYDARFLTQQTFMSSTIQSRCRWQKGTFSMINDKK